MQQTFASQRLLTVEGLSNYLGLTERYIRRLVAEDRIPVTRIGRGKLFFDVEAIDRWVSRSTTQPMKGSIK